MKGSISILITGAVAKNYNEGPLDYAEIKIENAEPLELKKFDRLLRSSKRFRSNTTPAGRKPKSSDLKKLEERLFQTCYNYKTLRAAWLKVQKSRSSKVKLDDKYPDPRTLVKRFTYMSSDITRVLRIGQIASETREESCAPHLKHLLPKNIVQQCIETSDVATLESTMGLLCNALRLLSLAAMILQDVDQGKTGVARLLRKPRIYADRIIGKIPSDEVVTRMVLGRAETHAGSAAHTNEIMRVPFVDKVAISIFGLVPANDIWPDTKQHPEVYDLKQFFDLAVLIGRLSLGEIVTTSRLMVERLYWEMGNQSEDVEGKKWFVELRAARQLMFSILATYTTKQSWDHVKTQMEADGSEITIIPNMNGADIVPII